MYIVNNSEKMFYELANIVRLFYPTKEIKWKKLEESENLDSDVVFASSSTIDTTTKLLVELKMASGKTLTKANSIENMRVKDHIALGKMLYEILSEISGKKIEWGVLTGIRPVKIARKMRMDGMSYEDIEAYFENEYLVSQKKAKLCVRTEEMQKDIVNSSLPNGYSMYISVPFCPSRCTYCSFVSHSIEKARDLIPLYVDKMCEEIRHTGELMRGKNLVLQSIYMGGGTPTTLNADEMRQVLTTVRDNFDLSQCKEITVEAGRPDTITADKLQVLKELGVNRISVNCQTLNDEVLEEIGRKHTAEEFFSAYELVKSFNFDTINVDLIAGLPKDSFESFKNSIDRVIALNPENITIHALTVKRAATLAKGKDDILSEHNTEGESEISQMINYSQNALSESYEPYYLYRQKGTVESLENVGFSKNGHECYYNIYIMDEAHSIVSFGAGGVTKVVIKNPNDENDVRIERIFNLKYPYEYINRFEEAKEKKNDMMALFDEVNA